MSESTEFSNTLCHLHNYICAECERCISDEQYYTEPTRPLCCECDAESDPT